MKCNLVKVSILKVSEEINNVAVLDVETIKITCTLEIVGLNSSTGTCAFYNFEQVTFNKNYNQ